MLNAKSTEAGRDRFISSIGAFAATLGAVKGIEFLFKPDFTKLNGIVVLPALGLSFFKLSLGMETMTTYGSYQPDSVDLVGNAAKVAFSNILISLLAGLAIFPKCPSEDFLPPCFSFSRVSPQ